MTTEYSLISVHFKRIDVKDNILIHWNILPNGVPTIVKGELLDDEFNEIRMREEKWKDERYSANRGLRLFRIVEQDMKKEFGMLPQKKVKIGIDPAGKDIVVPVHEPTEPKKEDKEQEPGVNPFELLTVKDLKGILESRDQTYPSKANKATLIDLILDPSTASTETPNAASTE